MCTRAYQRTKREYSVIFSCPQGHHVYILNKTKIELIKYLIQTKIIFLDYSMRKKY